jgi:hypothetical protein
MAERVRLRVEIAFEYDADPEDYGTDIPEDMAKVDFKNYSPHPHLIVQDFEGEGLELRVIPVEEGE